MQTHRGIVERCFPKLKKWQILQGGNIESIDKFEMELDSCMALQNLIERHRLGLMEGIPARAPFVAYSHIITKDVEPNMSIPKSITQDNAKFPPHWKEVMRLMTSVMPDIKKILKGGSEIDIFSKRVLKRGDNLHSGGHCVQISSQVLQNDVIRYGAWTYATMKPPCYQTFFDVQKGVGVIRSVCTCKNRYVFGVHLELFDTLETLKDTESNTNIFFLAKIFARTFVRLLFFLKRGSTTRVRSKWYS